MNLQEFAQVLGSAGYSVKSGFPGELRMVKAFDTAVGERELSISVFPDSPQLARGVYVSGGGNALNPALFDFSDDAAGVLASYEAQVDASYARSLWLAGVRPAEITS